MAASKKTIKKKSSKAKTRSSDVRSSSVSSSAHRRATEKMVIAAIISMFIIGFVVWFSQDFQAEGQAYSIGLEIENQQAIAIAVVTSCQTPGGCAYVDSVAMNLGDNNIYLNGDAVDPYQLVYFDASGYEVAGEAYNLIEDGVVTVSYLGERYPVSYVIIK